MGLSDDCEQFYIFKVSVCVHVWSMAWVCFALTEQLIQNKQAQQNNNICALSCYFTDHKSGNTSLDTLLALLQTEGAKIEEETEVSIVSLSAG